VIIFLTTLPAGLRAWISELTVPGTASECVVHGRSGRDALSVCVGGGRAASGDEGTETDRQRGSQTANQCERERERDCAQIPAPRNRTNPAPAKLPGSAPGLPAKRKPSCPARACGPQIQLFAHHVTVTAHPCTGRT
jgi:hypothetical protein